MRTVLPALLPLDRPPLHKGHQRPSCVPETIAGPYGRKEFRDLHAEIAWKKALARPPACRKRRQ